MRVSVVDYVESQVIPQPVIKPVDNFPARGLFASAGGGRWAALYAWPVDVPNKSGSGSQYFESRPQAGTRPGRVNLVLPDMHLELTADRGVFSADRIDPGTRVLLETVPSPAARGHLLDLGCGYGPVGLAMAVRAPGATVWAVDVNERALALTRQNAATAGLGNVRTCHPGEVDPTVRFTTIWSNPPVRVGKPALQALLAEWLSRLADDGAAYLVVHKHLGSDSLHRWLLDQGWPTQRRTSRAGYRVLEVRGRGNP